MEGRRGPASRPVPVLGKSWSAPLPAAASWGITGSMPTRSARYWIYIIRTVDDRLYSGVTTDVARRFREHLAGGKRAARYLKAHPPKVLAFSMPIGTRSQAQKVEAHLKRLSRPCKEALIRQTKLDFDPDTGAIRI